MARYDYNLVAVGAGAAGLVSSYIASAVKARVALIEKNLMGGDCLNYGCVPSKSLISSAKLVHQLNQHDRFGLKEIQYQVDFPLVMDRIQEIIEAITPHDSVERYTSLGVECIEGSAKLVSPHELEVNGSLLSTKNIVIATGASPAIPPIPGLEDSAYSTSDSIWKLRELPKQLLIIGGGPIGCELAQAFRRLGSEVTILTRDPKVLPKEDRDLAELVLKNFESEGIQMQTEVQVDRIEKKNSEQQVYFRKDGVEQHIKADHILLATGRKPGTSGLGLKEVGVELNPDGTVKVDPFLRSSIPNIYACGDVAGPFQFTHVAGHQAWYATVNALFSPFKKFAVDYRVVPWCTFTDPELARVGLSEEDALAQNIAYEKTSFDLSGLDRAIAERNNYGMIKVLTKPGKDQILGAAICGPHAGDLLSEFVLAMKHGIGLNKILGTIHAYPTYADANKLTAGVWRKNHAPDWVFGLLQRFHRWRRNA